MKTFEDWCALIGREPIPAAPALVAQFVAEIAPMGIDDAWEAVCETSRAHNAVGLADPTLSETVTLAMNGISQIDPPRSWPKREKERFLRLPHDLQTFFWMHAAKRESEMGRLKGEIGKLKQRITELENGVSKAAAA
jgi:hypothetical protein